MTPSLGPTPVRDPVELGTILGVWAHPDDEAYLSAGIMAMARQADARVVCVTATQGEAGTADPVQSRLETTAAVRAAELESSLAILGVREHHWLGYADGVCAAVDVDMAATRLLEIMEEVVPDTVLTFGPEGFTDHPDHKAVSMWVDHACARHRRRSGVLHHAVQTTAWVAHFAPHLISLGVFKPGTPPGLAPAELSIDVTLPGDVAALKWDALVAQESQTLPLIALVGEDLYRRAFVTHERFRGVA